MKRFDCLRAIAPYFREELVVTNLGGVRHEWHYLRPYPGNYHLQNLGLTSSVGLGLALALPHRKVVVFDGDGSMLLNLGGLATMANLRPKNLILTVFDNECYESSRGAPTATSRGPIRKPGAAGTTRRPHPFVLLDKFSCQDYHRVRRLR